MTDIYAQYEGLAYVDVRMYGCGYFRRHGHGGKVAVITEWDT